MSEKTWEQAGAATGVCFVALILASIFVVPSPPHIDAPYVTVAHYYYNNRGGLLTSAALEAIGSLFFLWFVSHIRHVLQRAEGGSEALSPVVFVSGTAVAVIGLVALTPSAALAFGSHRIDVVFSPSVVLALFYIGNVMNGVLALAVASFLASASMAAVRREFLAPPLGYAGLLFAAGAFAEGISAFYASTYHAAWLGLQRGALLAGLAWVLVASVAMVVGPEAARAELAPTTDAE